MCLNEHCHIKSIVHGFRFGWWYEGNRRSCLLVQMGIELLTTLSLSSSDINMESRREAGEKY